MRSIYIFSLLVASALAGDNNNYYGQPMDYFDDDFQSNMRVGPDSTFTFNFEQTRRDQPPQVEMREENVGRYIHTRPQTTTTPASIFSMKADKESQHVYPKMTANNYNHQQDHHWNGPQVSSVPPPPKFAFSRQNNQPIQKNSAPAWNAPAVLESNQPIQKNSAPAWNTPAIHQNTYPSNSYYNYPHHVPAAPTPAPHHAQWTAPQKPQTTPSPSLGIHFAPSASYISDSISNNNAPRQPPTLPSRGNHKFSWDDVKSTHEHKQTAPIVHNPQPPVSTSTPQSIHNKPPPPVPTLSPWYDGFGK